MLPDNHVRGESNYYYVMMTIWYTWKYFKDNPDWKLLSLRKLTGQKEEQDGLLFDHNHLPSDNWTFAKGDRNKVPLLQWYHYGSLLELCKNDVLPKSWQGNSDLLEQKVARLAKAAKMRASAKLFSQEPYVADDEILDRLSFVSNELGLENIKSQSVGIIELLSMKRVKQRYFTRSLNPGWLPRDEEESTSGPWEIHALCHHSRLVVLIKEEESKQDWRTEEHTKAEEESFRQRICIFLNAEGTLIPCWERAHAKARRGWLRSEATAVVASTLLTILQKPLTDSSTRGDKGKLDDVPAGNPALEQPEAEESVSPPPESSPDPKELVTEVAKLSNTMQNHNSQVAELSNTVRDHNHQVRLDQRKLFQEISHLDGLMKDQLEAFERFSNESSLLPPIQWRSFRPTSKYHPVSFFNSLEDTPDLYKPEELGKVSVPLSLNDHIRLPEDLEKTSTEFSKRDLDEVVRMKCLSLFDIRATGPDEDAKGFTWETKKWRFKYDDSIPSSANRFSWALYDNVSKLRSALHTLY
jgi:hypothetical protein